MVKTDEAAVDKLKDGMAVMFTAIAALRHATAKAKIPYMLAHIEDAFEESEPDWKIVFFAHHIDVLNAVHEQFKDRAVMLRGGIAKGRKQAAVDRFQSEDDVRLFCGQIMAAGVGLTLTRSSHVIMGELDWTPGNVSQAEDRCHRIVQKDNVLVQHLVLEGSLDATIAKRMVVKQNVIDASLDDIYTLEEVGLPLVPEEETEQAATQGTSRGAINQMAQRLTRQQVAAAHLAVKMIAGLKEGLRPTGEGFNAIDKIIGQRLAELESITEKQAALAIKIARRYHRQLPDSILDVIGRPKKKGQKN